MVVPYLARAVLATPAHAFVPCCPGVWQTLCDVSSFTVRLHRLFGVIYLNDCRDRVTVIVMRVLAHLGPRRPPMCPRPLYGTPCACCGPATFPTSATLTTATLRTASSTTALGSFALATSTMAQRAIIRIEHSCRPSVRAAHA
uniref:Secreted protein n=1 Tax=Oryza glumipatula TaxID=40148 RepID=A0A0E0ATX2_9ORYZ